MKKYYLIILTILLGVQIHVLAQNDGGVSIGKGNNDADESAILELVSDSKGLLIPRLTSTEREDISSPAVGLLVFDTDSNVFYYYTGEEWQAITGIETSIGIEAPTSGIKEGDLFYNTSDGLLYVYISGTWEAAGSQSQVLELDGTILKLLKQGESSGSEIDLSSLLIADSISVTPSGILTSTNVQSALEEILNYAGDMQKTTYDKDDNGVVDSVENAQKVNNNTVETSVPAGAVFTDNQQLSISGNQITLSSNGGTSSSVVVPSSSSGTIGDSVIGTPNQIEVNTDVAFGTITLSLPDTITGLTSVTAINFLGNATTATTSTIATTATNLASGAKGSIPYQTINGQTTMLEKGTDGQILSIDSGVPVWCDNIDSICSIKGTKEQITAITDSAGTVTLALSDTITGLKSVTATNFLGNATTATNAVLANSAVIATTTVNIASGASGSIPYQTAAGETAMLDKGSNGQILSIDSGVPAWKDISVAGGGISSVKGTANKITANTNSGVVTLSLPDTITGLKIVTADTLKGVATTATNIASGASGSIPYQTASGKTTMLSTGTDGQVLTLASGVPSWADATGSSSGISSVTGTSNQITASTSSGAVTLSLPSTITGLTSVTATTFNGTATKATTATTATNIASGAAGSIPYQTASGTTGMLGKGTDGQVLTLASGVPSWADATGGINSVTGTSNQITASTSSGAVSLSLPSTITGLTSVTATTFNGTATKATTATNLASGASGSIPYQTASGTTTMLGKGTNGQVLTLASGVPTWADATGSSSGISSVTGTSNQITASTSSGAVTLSLPSTITGLTSVTATTFNGTATTATNLASGASGSIPYQTASGTTGMLGKGTDGQVLTLASGVPSWADASGGSVSAENGLTESSSTIKLGGTLTAATEIDQDDNNMTFTTGNAKMIVDGAFKATGAVYANVTEVTDASYSITDSDFMLILTIAGGSSITLPDPSSYPGRMLCVRNNSAEQGTSGTIQYSTYVPVNNSTVLASRAQMLISDGSNWYVLAGL